MIATIVATLFGLAGIIFGLFKHQAANLATAKAALSDAERQNAVDKLKAVAADQAAAQAAQAQVDVATTVRTGIDAQTAAKSAEEVQNELNQKFAR